MLLEFGVYRVPTESAGGSPEPPRRNSLSARREGWADKASATT